MQATVSAFDPQTRAGKALLDDGVEVSFGADALSRTRLRFLRPGQRVRLETTGHGASLQVTGVQILTLS
jgi:cold shock CspA family protein